jgi:hypothetical protein
MVTPRQVRAARVLLQWDQIMLADKSVVALSAVQRLEQGKPVREATAHAVEQALKKAGIGFISAHGEEGVVLRRRGRR